MSLRLTHHWPRRRSLSISNRSRQQKVHHREEQSRRQLKGKQKMSNLPTRTSCGVGKECPGTSSTLEDCPPPTSKSVAERTMSVKARYMTSTSSPVDACDCSNVTLSSVNFNFGLVLWHCVNLREEACNFGELKLVDREKSSSMRNTD